ncbi:putative ribonuclease H-like domain-containing protein [Rosa chinensis]|uniref:Putative ribonuclease H-like domain-containing protein n=1 Tax=Rosa chinensis TaxID=74649 RepID=A0A2P6S8H7_ROSCH|nr:putative ribonuclease H-like domain-containing protein [Rosa chinensis]
MASASQCHHLLVECDSEVLVSLINHGVDELHPLKTIIDCCNSLRRQFWSCEITHVYREINQVADVLSKAGLDTDIGVMPPPQVMPSLMTCVKVLSASDM